METEAVSRAAPAERYCSTSLCGAEGAAVLTAAAEDEDDVCCGASETLVAVDGGAADLATLSCE